MLTAKYLWKSICEFGEKEEEAIEGFFSSEGFTRSEILTKKMLPEKRIISFCSLGNCMI